MDHSANQQTLNDAQQRWFSIFTQPHSTPPQPHDNIRENTNLAANAAVGDVLTNPKPDESSRFYFINPNGFQLNASGGTFAEFCAETKRISADYIGVSEHNLDGHQSRVKKICHDTARREFDHYSLILSSSDIPTDTSFKPGGTMSLTVGSMTARIKSSGSDPMGRWTYTKFVGTRGKIITIITAYQVCDKPVTTATKKKSRTAAAQQVSMMRIRGITNTHPRKQFCADLRNFLQECTNQNEEILLAGDFNEALGTNISGMTKICTDFGLVDILMSHHGTDTPTYVRGTTRIDYALATPHVAAACTTCGYEPFQHRFTGDHRGMFLDLNTNALFGSATVDLSTPAEREFNTRDRASNRRYVEAKHKYLTQHQWFQRLTTCTTDPEPNHAIAEGLDRDWLRASKYAANQVKKKPNCPFSHKLSTARKKKNVLQRIVSQATLHVDFSDSIAYFSRTGYDFLIPPTLLECQIELKKAQSDIRKTEKDAVNYRRVEQQRRIADLLAEGKPGDANRIKHQVKAEEIKAMFRKIRSVQGTIKQGLTRLLVPQDTEHDPKTCTEWVSVDLPRDIENHLRARNRKHFGQAEGTPPTMPPFSDHVDWAASTRTAELILDGDYSPPELDSLMQSIVDHMSATVELDKFPATITVPEWEGKIKIWDERTTTSPSGLHLGHHKALVRPHDLTLDTDEGKELENQRLALLHGQVALLNYALTHGYSFDRWKVIVNVMLLKEPNNPRIHRLRVIHLYEADFNLLLGVKWRNIIHHSLDQDSLHPSQYGGLPGRESLIPVFIEEMQNEIARASRKPYIKQDFDATSCYDRIIPWMASMLSRSHGLHKNVCLVHARTLQEARYLLKTQLGVSEEFYSHCRAFPIYGTGQGSGNSPMIWCFISSMLFTIHQENAIGASYTSPDRSIFLRLFMVGFVDDTYGTVNDFARTPPPTTTELVSMAQHDSQLWSDLLHRSGGALELAKSKYHTVSYLFTPSGAPVLQGGQVGPDLCVTSGDASTTMKFQHLSAYTAHKTLGCYKEPSGNQRAAAKHLLANSNRRACQLSTSPLNRKESWTFYHSVYLPSVSYSLPVGHLAPTMLHKIQAPAIRTFLPKCGYNRNMPRVVVFGPQEYGGMGFRNLAVEQGAGQIEYFLKFWRTDCEAGSLLRIALSWNQLMAGVSWPILQNVTAPLPHLETKWLPSLRDFLCSIDSDLEIDTPFTYPIQREHDFHIMDLVLESGRFKTREIRMLNYCRLFLGVTTISDVATADGKEIDRTMFLGNPSLLASRNKWMKAEQAKPYATAWVLWRRALRLWSDWRGRLHQPLGRWLLPGPSLGRTWSSYVTKTSKTLILVKEGVYESYSPKRHRIYPVTPDGTITSLPLDAYPVSIKFSPRSIKVHRSPGLFPIFAASQPRTFEEYLDTLAPWDRLLFDHLDLSIDPYVIIETLASTTAIYSASDGSVKDHQGSFGWLLSTPDGTVILKCSGPAYGRQMKSYRAEGYGVLSLLRFIYHLYTFCHTPLPAALRLFCDSKSLLDKTHTYLRYPRYYPNTTLQPDWDIVQQIAITTRLFPTSPHLIHVKAHQDDAVTFADLPVESQLNVRADTLAKEYNATSNHKTSAVPRMPCNAAQLHCQGQTVTSRYRSTIRREALTPAIRDYTMYRNEWTHANMDMVHWEAHSQALRKNFLHRTFLVKFIHDKLPVGKMIALYKNTFDHRCPSCQDEFEDRTHFLRCPHPERVPWQLQLATAIRKRCDNIPTRPYLMDILIDGLTHWFADTAFIKEEYPLAFHALIDQQDQLGWHQILLGRFGTLWSDLQSAHLRHSPSTGGKHSGTSWILSMIITIWTAVQAQWEVRNKIKHGDTDATRLTSKLAQVLRETEALYELKHSTLPCDQAAFYPSFAIHQASLTTYTDLRAWVNTWRPTFIRSVKDAKEQGVAQQQPIDQYFPPHATLPSTPNHP